MLPLLVGMLPEEGGHLGQVHRVLGEAQGQGGGLEDGGEEGRQADLVEVKSPAGRGQLKARVTEAIRPDTVYMDTGFGVISKGLSKIFGNCRVC